MPIPIDLHHVQQSYYESQAEMRDAQRQFGNIRKYAERQQAQIQQELNTLRPRALTDPDAARKYQELTEQNGRLIQILTDPSGY